MAITRSRSKPQKKGGSTGRAAKPPAKKVRNKAKKDREASIPVSRALSSTEKIVRMLDSVVPVAIGGLVLPECLAYHPMRDKLLKLLKENSLSENPKMKIWVYLQVETLCDAQNKDLITACGGFKDVPVFIIIYSEVEPISYGASCSTQLQSNEFFDFEEKSLKWVEVLPRVNFLQTTQTSKLLFGTDPSTVELSFEFAILPIRRPIQIANLGPYKVEYASMVYKGVDITASCKSEVDAIIEGEAGLTEEDREPIITALKVEKEKEKQTNQEFVDAEKSRYGGMIASLAEANGMDQATVEIKLKEMKLFKIYPSSIPSPVMTWTGHTTGFDTSNAKINRFIGNADKVY